MNSEQQTATGQVIYQTRLNLLEKVRQLTLDEEGVCIEENGKETRVAFSDIQTLRCRFFPTRFQKDRYECLFTTGSGLKVKIANQFFKGVADFEDRSQAYRKFVVALHVGLAKHNPDCTFRSGASPTAFYLNAGIFLLIVAAVVGFIFLAGASLPTIALAKLVIALITIPIALRWFYKNKPRIYRGRAIPTDILPEKEVS